MLVRSFFRATPRQSFRGRVPLVRRAATGPAAPSTPSGDASHPVPGAPQPGGGHKSWSGPVSWATLGLVVVGGAAAVIYNNVVRDKKKAEASTKVESYGKPALGGPWSLVQADGTPITSGDLQGRFVLMYFGFTFCPDICPNELVKMSKVASTIEERLPGQTLTPVFVTLDPYRDSCAQVGVYARDFHPRMLALTGTPAQVGRIAKKFRVYFAEVDHAEEDDDYLVDHSIVMYLMSPEGEFLEFYTQLMTASEIATKTEGVMRAWKKAHK